MPQPPVSIIGDKPDQGIIEESHTGIVFLHGSKLLNQYKISQLLYERDNFLYETDNSEPGFHFKPIQKKKPANNGIRIKAGLLYIIPPSRLIAIDSFVVKNNGT